MPVLTANDLKLFQKVIVNKDGKPYANCQIIQIWKNKVRVKGLIKGTRNEIDERVAIADIELYKEDEQEQAVVATEEAIASVVEIEEKVEFVTKPSFEQQVRDFFEQQGLVLIEEKPGYFHTVYKEEKFDFQSLAIAEEWITDCAAYGFPTKEETQKQSLQSLSLPLPINSEDVKQQSDKAIATILTKPTPEFFRSCIAVNASDSVALGFAATTTLSLDRIQELFDIDDSDPVAIALELSLRGLSLIQKGSNYIVTS